MDYGQTDEKRRVPAGEALGAVGAPPEPSFSQPASNPALDWEREAAKNLSSEAFETPGAIYSSEEAGEALDTESLRERGNKTLNSPVEAPTMPNLAPEGLDTFLPPQPGAPGYGEIVSMEPVSINTAPRSGKPLSPDKIIEQSLEPKIKTTDSGLNASGFKAISEAEKKLNDGDAAGYYDQIRDTMVTNLQNSYANRANFLKTEGKAA